MIQASLIFLGHLFQGGLPKTLDAFYDIVSVTEEEAFELGFTLAARLMMDVMRLAKIPSIDDI